MLRLFFFSHAVPRALRMACLQCFVVLWAMWCVAPACADNARPSAARLLLDAAAKSDSTALQRALDMGAAIDTRDAQGHTPLLIAIARGDDASARVLIERGADINAQAANRDTPWLLAGAEGRTEMLRLMLARGGIDYAKRNRFGGNALIPAAHHGHVETVRLLVSAARIDIDHVNDLGWTALLEAILLGDGGAAHTQIVELLVAGGANVNLADREGVTPLKHARQRGQTKIVEILLARGARETQARPSQRAHPSLEVRPSK